MKQFKALAIIMTIGLLFCLVNLSMAQEVQKAAPEAQETTEEAEYSYGTVTSISADKLVVKEYDYESELEKDVEYAIDPKVELKNADAIANIASGANVEIDYIVRDNKKIATVIAVEKETDEDIIPETADDEPIEAPQE